MALGIQIGTEYLELPAGTSMEIERENPYLQFGDSLIGDISLPFNVPTYEVNMRLLNYAGLLQRRLDGTGIDAKVWDGAWPHSIGKIRIEKPTVNINQPGAGSISCYYLSGVSSFYKDAQNVRMRDVPLGGQRVFPWLGFNRNGAGFWAHIHAVIYAPVGAYDYAFFPVINRAWTGGWEQDAMNRMKFVNGVGIEFETHAPNNNHYLDFFSAAVCPFPYLKYVLVKAVEHCGWKIQGAILDDPDFNKITMLTFQAIDWRQGGILGGFNVKFDLKDSMPDINVSTFLIGLKNRFAWAYDFDRQNKLITIRPLDTLGTVVKDVTRFVDPVITKTVSAEKTGFALKGDWMGADAYESIDFTGLIDQGVVDHRSMLPAANAARENWVYLVAAENNYFVCGLNFDNGAWEWQLLAANVYDYQDPGEVTEITTCVNAAGSGYYNDYMDLVPELNINGRWGGPSLSPYTDQWSDDMNDHWGVYLVFYHGLRNNRSGRQIPYASHHIYDANGQTVGNWSLAFSAKTVGNNQEVGLVRNWNRFGRIFRSGEKLELTLNLPQEDYRNLAFSDAISVAGVRMFVQKTRSTIPYSNSVTCECIRI